MKKILFVIFSSILIATFVFLNKSPNQIDLFNLVHLHKELRNTGNHSIRLYPDKQSGGIGTIYLEPYVQ